VQVELAVNALVEIVEVAPLHLLHLVDIYLQQMAAPLPLMQSQLQVVVKVAFIPAVLADQVDQVAEVQLNLVQVEQPLQQEHTSLEMQVALPTVRAAVEVAALDKLVAQAPQAKEAMESHLL
jgi:hypothetical protein